jgi:hypothetical protein
MAAICSSWAESGRMSGSRGIMLPWRQAVAGAREASGDRYPCQVRSMIQDRRNTG